MNDKDFQKLVESVKQMGLIMRGIEKDPAGDSFRDSPFAITVAPVGDGEGSREEALKRGGGLHPPCQKSLK